MRATVVAARTPGCYRWLVTFLFGDIFFLIDVQQEAAKYDENHRANSEYPDLVISCTAVLVLPVASFGVHPEV